MKLNHRWSQLFPQAMQRYNKLHLAKRTKLELTVIALSWALPKLTRQRIKFSPRKANPSRQPLCLKSAHLSPRSNNHLQPKKLRKLFTSTLPTRLKTHQKASRNSKCRPIQNPVRRYITVLTARRCTKPRYPSREMTQSSISMRKTFRSWTKISSQKFSRRGGSVENAVSPCKQAPRSITYKLLSKTLMLYE